MKHFFCDIINTLLEFAIDFFEEVETDTRDVTLATSGKILEA